MKPKLETICACAKNISIFQTGSLYDCQYKGECRSKVGYGKQKYCGRELKPSEERKAEMIRRRRDNGVMEPLE